MNENKKKKPNYVSTTSGMRGRFPVLVDGETDEPIQTGETCATYDECVKAAKSWARAEGLEYK